MPKKDELSLNYKVKRLNELNRLFPKGWNLTEVRLLSIYQAKINARNPESRMVTFSLETFCEIMEIKRLNITQMKETVRSLLSKPVFLPNGKNGFIGIPLFVECEVLQDDTTNEWFIKIECHQKALEQHTDIKYTFEPIRRGRKIHALKFTIIKNKNFKDDLRIKEFISPEDLEDIRDISLETVKDSIDSLYYHCNESYSMEQLEVLYNYVESLGVKLNTSIENYIYSVYCKIKIKGNIINNLFKYTFAIIEKQVNDYIFNVQSVQREEIKNKKSKKESGFDLEEWKKIVNSTPRRMSNEECFFVLDDFDNIIGYVFASDFDKITNETWRILRNNFKNGHLSSKSDLGRNLLDLKK